MSDIRTTLQLAGSDADAASAANALPVANNMAAGTHTRARRVAQLLTLKVRTRIIPSAQLEQALRPVPGQTVGSILSVHVAMRDIDAPY